MVKNVFSAILLIIMSSASAIYAQTGEYNNITIDESIKISLEKNKDIINAIDESRRADYRITEAASGAYPQINGLFDYQKTLKQQVFVISFPDSTGALKKNRLKVGTEHSMSLGANLTQPLYVGGKVGTALKAAKIYKKMSGESLESVKQNVVSGVAQAFNGILLYQEIKKISLESLTQAENHLKNVQNLFSAGKATEYDVLRAKVNVANLQPAVFEADKNVEISLLRLKDIMGLNPETTLTVTGSFSEPDTSLFAIAGSKLAFEKRPDMKVAEMNIDLQSSAVKIARGDFLPVLSAGTSFAYSGVFDTFKYEAGDWTPYWYATVQLSFPIFTGFKNSSKLKQAKVDLQQAKTNLRKQQDTTSIEVEESVMNLRQAVKKIESQRMNVKEAERAVEISESLYTNGKATQLEVLDAQLAMELAKNNMASALYEGKVAEIMLKKSLGLIETGKNSELKGIVR